MANDGRQEFGETEKPNSYVAVFSIHDHGNVAPRWTIGGPYGILQKPRGVDLDPENRTIIVSDKHLNAVLTFSLPEMFE